MATLTAIRLPEEMLRKATRVANILNRSRSYIIRKALEIYLDEYIDYQIALERLNDKDDDIVNSKEMSRSIKK